MLLLNRLRGIGDVVLLELKNFLIARKRQPVYNHPQLKGSLYPKRDSMKQDLNPIFCPRREQVSRAQTSAVFSSFILFVSHSHHRHHHHS